MPEAIADGLDRLAERAGVEPGFQDAWGQRRALSAATKQALLQAMGFRAEAPEDIAAAIKDMEEAPWRRRLQPALVVRKGRNRTPAIPINLPSSDRADTMSWAFEHEMGEELQGTFRVADLPVAAAAAVDGVNLERRLFTLPFSPPYGYHRFRLMDSAGPSAEQASLALIVTPASCYLPRRWRGDGRCWGLSVQLYGLRSARNWGAGDYTDLGAFLESAAGLGAEAVGLNPLHALFPGNPAHAGPYSPSSRRFLNTLYIDAEAVPDLAECKPAQDLIGSAEFRSALEELRGNPLVDYVGVAHAKRAVLELLYGSFRGNHLGAEPGSESERGAEFRRFQLVGGRDLERLGRFEALCERFADHGPWRAWPAPYQDPNSSEVAAFSEESRERIEFFQYLQWQADLQLRSAADKRKDLGMAIGLYHDLALGADGNGAEAWGDQQLFAAGASLGAPPDDWNRKGQNWGMPPINPRALRDQAYGPIIGMLRANMRHGGALRMDHVMGMARLYWIPDGLDPSQGGYVSYPLEDLMGILALESRRQRCVVLGEDLGTVPQGFRSKMRRAGILSYRLLYFQKDAQGEFLGPEAYPHLAAAVVGTHDLATFPGYWMGRDLEVRAELGLYPSREAEDEARALRARERRQLVAALKREGLLPPGFSGEDSEPSPRLVQAVYQYLCKSPARIVMVHPEDVLGEENQINLPGTTDQHPNWRRKLPLDVEAIARDPRVVELAAMLREIRPRVPPRSRGG